jgi:hypothetical protein
LIVACDIREEALKGTVAKGEQLQVVGYKNVMDQKMKDRMTKPVEEVYAVTVKTIGSPSDS